MIATKAPRLYIGKGELHHDGAHIMMRSRSDLMGGTWRYVGGNVGAGWADGGERGRMGGGNGSGTGGIFSFFGNFKT